MRITYRSAASVGLAALMLAVLALFPLAASAQDAAMTEGAPVACDSTLVVLLLVAEHNYDYLTNMQTLPNVDLGQYAHVINDSISNMRSMAMSADQMATVEAMQSTLDSMMAMSANDMLAAYDKAMGGDMMSGDAMMTTLQPGNVAGENELCASVRTDVEKFLTAHVLADMESKSADSSMK